MMGCAFCTTESCMDALSTALKILELDLRYCPVCGVDLKKAKSNDALRQELLKMFEEEVKT